MAFRGSKTVVRTMRGVRVVSFPRPDVIDRDYIEQAGEEILGVVAACPRPPMVVIDFEGVQFLSSAALGMLIEVNREIRKHGGALRVANVGEEVQGVFDICRIAKIVQIYDSTRKAVVSLL